MSSRHWAAAAPDLLAKQSGLAPARQLSHSPLCLFVRSRCRGHQEACGGRRGYRRTRLTDAGLAAAAVAATRPFSNWVSAGNLNALWRYNESSNGDLDFYQHPRHPVRLPQPQALSAGSHLNVAHLWFHFHLHWFFFLIYSQPDFFSDTDRLINPTVFFFPSHFLKSDE